MYQNAQQSTWLTILILIKLQNHILQFQDISAFPPCSSSIQDGDYVTEHAETLIPACVYISHFVYMDHWGQDNHGR